MAKPFQCVEFPRSHIVRFRTTPAEKELLEQMAGDCGMSLSNFCRQQAMSRRFRSRLAATIINELVQLNAELREQRNRIDAEEYGAILAGIAEAIERIPADAQMEDF
jgi:hypothetical protein